MHSSLSILQVYRVNVHVKVLSLLISCLAEGRRLSWPQHTVTYSDIHILNIVISISPKPQIGRSLLPGDGHWTMTSGPQLFGLAALMA